MTNRKLLLFAPSASTPRYAYLSGFGLRPQCVTSLDECMTQVSSSRLAGAIVDFAGLPALPKKDLITLWAAFEQKEVLPYVIFGDDPRHRSLMEQLNVDEGHQIPSTSNPSGLFLKLLAQILPLEAPFLQKVATERKERSLGLAKDPTFARAFEGKFSVCRFPFAGLQLALLIPDTVAPAAIGALAATELNHKVKLFVWHEKAWHPLAMRPADPTQASIGENPVPKLLVVEDSVTERRVLEKILVTAGYHVLASDNVTDALKQIQKNRDIKLLFLNIGLQEMDGFQLMKLLEQHDLLGQLTVCVVTTNGQKKVISKALSMGARDVILKPLDPDVVIGKLSAVLAPLLEEYLAGRK